MLTKICINEYVILMVLNKQEKKKNRTNACRGITSDDNLKKIIVY